jgi:hypothetical protein
MQIKDMEISTIYVPKDRSMNHRHETGVRLEFSSGRPAITDVADINSVLANHGSRIRPLDLRGVPEPVRQLLNQPTLNAAESAQVQEHFLLSRERLLDIIREAGRTPQVPGGGNMSTLDSTHGILYPQLYIAETGVDYSRFDRFHVNVSDDGTGVDEVGQVLSGGVMRILQHLPDVGLVTLYIDCIEGETGWIVTYDGANPHIGSFSRARMGTKALVQVIGPAKWEMKYVDPTQE